MISTLKLLLIEDDASMQAALQRALKRRAKKVQPCADDHLALAHQRMLSEVARTCCTTR